MTNGKKLLGARIKMLSDWNEPIEKVINQYARTRPVRAVFMFDMGFPVVFINDKLTSKKFAEKYTRIYVDEYLRI